MTALLCVGVQESARANAVMVFVKVAAILLFIAVAAFNVDPANWVPFIPERGPNPFGDDWLEWEAEDTERAAQNR